MARGYTHTQGKGRGRGFASVGRTERDNCWLRSRPSVDYRPHDRASSPLALGPQFGSPVPDSREEDTTPQHKSESARWIMMIRDDENYRQCV